MAEMRDPAESSSQDDWKNYINDNDHVSYPIDGPATINEELFDEFFDRKPSQAIVDSSIPNQTLQNGLTQAKTFDESQLQAEANQSYVNDFIYPLTPSYDEPGAMQSEFDGPYFAAPVEQFFENLNMDFDQPLGDWSAHVDYEYVTQPIQENTANPLTPNGIVRLQPVPAGESPYGDFSTPTPAPRPATRSIRIPQPIEYQYRFSDFAEAHAAIAASNMKEQMIQLNVNDDDLEVVRENQHVHAYASRLLSAATIMPTEAPQIMASGYQKTYWLEHQQCTLIGIQNMITQSPERAEARALLTIEAVLHLHQVGCPASVMGRKTLKEGYKVDTTLTASARVEQILLVATNDKYVAHDILTGTNLPDIVRSPMAYMRRKADNSRVNAKKANDKEEADRSKGLVSRKKGGGRRKGSAIVPDGAYATPAPSSPASFYEDVTPIPFSLGAGRGRAYVQDEDMEFTLE